MKEDKKDKAELWGTIPTQATEENTPTNETEKKRVIKWLEIKERKFQGETDKH